MGTDAKEFHPIEVLREQGGLSASIYRGVGQSGPYYTVEFYREGQSDEKLKVIRCFRQKHLLHLAQLIIRVYMRIAALKMKDRTV